MYGEQILEPVCLGSNPAPAITGNRLTQASRGTWTSYLTSVSVEISQLSRYCWPLIEEKTEVQSG